MDDKILEGTTTVGITCKDGVVFASERRASTKSQKKYLKLTIIL